MAFFGPSWMRDIDAIHREMERLLDHYAGSKPPSVLFAKRGFEPAVDVYETDDAVVIVAELAGVDCERIDVALHQQVLSIRGERIAPGSGRKRSYSQMEINSGPFERIIRLPIAVDSDGATARYADGMLEITLPKSKAPPPSRTFVRIVPKENER